MFITDDNDLTHILYLRSFIRQLFTNRYIKFINLAKMCYSLLHFFIYGLFLVFLLLFLYININIHNIQLFHFVLYKSVYFS